MLVPVVDADSTSVSPANLPPITATLAPARARLSGSDIWRKEENNKGTVSLPNATGVPTRPLKLGGSVTCVTEIVLVTGVLTWVPPLAVPLPSLTIQTRVRLGFEP